MKIDEPKTPYEYEDDEQQDGDREMTEEPEDDPSDVKKAKAELTQEEKEVMESLKLAQ